MTNVFRDIGKAIPANLWKVAVVVLIVDLFVRLFVVSDRVRACEMAIQAHESRIYGLYRRDEALLTNDIAIAEAVRVISERVSARPAKEKAE